MTNRRASRNNNTDNVRIT